MQNLDFNAKYDLAGRLDAVRARILAACRRAGRDPETVDIIAVAKGHGPEAVMAARAAGLRRIGENRVQEAIRKADSCASDLEWHMVGHLQRNKLPAALPLFAVLHSVDSMRLAEALQAASERDGARPEILIEVNVSGEASKFGLPPEAVAPVIETVLSSRTLDLRGFMTMAPFVPDPEAARPVFARLRELRDQWSRTFGTPFDVLSMGMSNDFEVAVEEGATWLRLGTVLFGPRRAIPRGAGAGGPAVSDPVPGPGREVPCER